jgi:hypothetical protein
MLEQATSETAKGNTVLGAENYPEVSGNAKHPFPGPLLLSN